MKILTLALCLFLSLFSLSARAEPEDEFLFRFRFAMLKEQSVGVRTVYVQAEHGTQEAMARVCGLSGLACACEFLDQAGNLLQRTDQVSFDYRGNYFRCPYTGAHPAPAFARVVERKPGGLAGPILPLETPQTLTLQHLIGSDLDMNRVRSVYRYTCEHAYLQKHGTTTQSFDCSYQPVSCDPDGTSTKNFCLLKGSFPYHLYADTYSTNFHQKISDKLYNGGGTGSICGMQIKQYDCAGMDHYPERTFGIFGESAGYWDTEVRLKAAPEQLSSVFGFAARPSAETGECPPGLEKRVHFRAEVITSDIYPSHNFVSGLMPTEVFLPSATPSSFTITKLAGGTGGNCDGTRCSAPNSFAGFVKAFAYSSAGQAEFCVIPSELLP